MTKCWDKKTTRAIKSKFDEWRSKRIPSTANGKSLVIKNSCLAKAWYLVTNQAPPLGINRYMREWEKEAWIFFEDTNFCSAGRGPHASVKRTVLTQDYAETGSRCIDIENFVRAIYAVWVIRRLPHPSPMPWKNIAFYYINKTYGHLRQGARLLTSQCDFLHLKDVPPFWESALQAAGMLSFLHNTQRGPGKDLTLRCRGGSAPPPHRKNKRLMELGGSCDGTSLLQP